MPAKKNIKEEREGMIFTSNQGSNFIVVEYANSSKVLIQFMDKHKYETIATWSNIIRGNVRNLYHPTVCDIGYLGNGKHKASTKDRKQTIVYTRWQGMLSRCYRRENKAYEDCIVCDEWHNFQNFAQWYEDNYYNIGETLDLDKDILCKNNNIYSPDTCILTPNSINLLFVKSGVMKGKYPIGVWHDSKNKKLGVSCRSQITGGKVFLGYFNYNQVEEAFNAYKIYKENHIKEVAELYKDKIPDKLYQAMLKYEVEITD